MKINNSDTIKVILPSLNIPDGATVTKVGGQKKYTLRRVIKIYGGGTTDDGKTMVQTIDAAPDACYIVSDTGDANIIFRTTELMWHVNAGTLLDKLREDIYS